jgi:hypothetical protein
MGYLIEPCTFILPNYAENLRPVIRKRPFFPRVFQFGLKPTSSARQVPANRADMEVVIKVALDPTDDLIAHSRNVVVHRPFANLKGEPLQKYLSNLFRVGLLDQFPNPLESRRVLAVAVE